MVFPRQRWASHGIENTTRIYPTAKERNNASNLRGRDDFTLGSDALLAYPRKLEAVIKWRAGAGSGEAKGGTEGEAGWKRDGKGVENFQSSCAFDVGPFNGSVIHGL
ncbi:hypothetical protein K0M31_020006 [Melipona bicolor]|uniref:Uncharacterized protein n=1 Tax=Melipona bicolor TaxID=60889 RepID=A0AA40G1P0_9HYME|nr:hypothetical protein K0M31_020006 [Melipona bicolor]